MRMVSYALLMLLAASCASDDGPIHSPSLAASGADAIAVLEALEHECLQYPVGHSAEGDELWHADFVYFDLVDESQDLYIAEDGLPLASGLLYHEVIAVMEEQPEIPGTMWTYRVQRVVQHVRDGNVRRNESHRNVDDAEVWELMEKNRRARSDEAVVLPEVRRPTG